MPISKRINPRTGREEFYDTQTGMAIGQDFSGILNRPTEQERPSMRTINAEEEEYEGLTIRSSLGRLPETEDEAEALLRSGQITDQQYVDVLNKINLDNTNKLKTGTEDPLKTSDLQTGYNQKKRLPPFNLAGSDLKSELYSLGMNLGKPAGMKGKGLGIISSAGAALLGATGDIMSGYGYQVASERNRKWYQDQMKKQQYIADDQYGDTNTVGVLPTGRFGGYFEDGGMADGEGLVEQTEENGDEPKISIEKLLTGENIKGLSEKGGMEANVEVEGDEYLQFPDGTTQRVVGKDHEEGGVKMNIPDGTKVISKTLKPNKKQVKELEKTYSLNVGKTDTYAEVVDKFANKIGLTKKYKEQEELFTALKDLFKDTKIAPATKRLNQDFLSGKIAKIENEKAELEAQKQEFFNTVFDMQEESKPEEERGQEVFKMGGTSYAGFNELAQKHDVNPADLMDVLRKAGATNLPNFKDGGGKLKASTNQNKFSKEERVRQSANKENYGTDKKNEEIILNLYKNFPDIILDDEVFGKYVDKEKLKKGEVVFNKKVPMNTKNAAVLNFQKKADARMKASADTIINNPERFDKSTVEMATKYKTEQTFYENESKDASQEQKIRLYDEKMGNFTSGRYSLGLDVVTPEEKKALSESGIFTLNQIPEDQLTNLSEESQARIKALKEIKGEDADYSINTYTPAEVPAESEEEPNKKVENPDPTKDTDLDVNLSGQRPYQSKMFYMPDQSTLPPSALKVGVNIQNTLQRMDPVRIGIEQNLQEAADSRQFIAEQLNGMPSAQRAAGMASLLATTQEGINKSIVDTNRINAANIAATEQFNTNISNEEQMLNNEHMYSYDQRALTAEAKTEEELRNWMDRNQKVALSNFSQQQRLNLYDASIPDYEINFMGLGVDYDRSYDWRVQTENYRRTQPEVAPKDLTKAGLEKMIQQYGIDPESIRFK